MPRRYVALLWALSKSAYNVDHWIELGILSFGQQL